MLIKQSDYTNSCQQCGDKIPTITDKMPTIRDKIVPIRFIDFCPLFYSLHNQNKIKSNI